MSDSFETNLLVGTIARQLGLVDDDVLAESINTWSKDASQDLRTLLQQQGQLDDETWDSLQTLATKHVQQVEGSVLESLSTLYSLAGDVPETVLNALKGSGREELWKTLVDESNAAPRSGSTQSDSAKGKASNAPGNRADTGGLRGERFQKVKKHAAGGLGQVFIAIDDELNRQVALKQIKGRFTSDSDARQRFMLEAEITGGLEHPGVVPVYGLGVYRDGQPYYAMRFIRGESMQAAIKALHKKCPPGRGLWNSSAESMFELRKLLSRVIDVCQAIGYAHSRGVLHRDIKPDNIMLGKFGETLVVDWGLAKVDGSDSSETKSEQGPGEPKLIPASGRDSAPTQMGRVVGTPGFMSPEQASGDVEQLDARSDVYSLGATLYSLLVGRPAIDSKDHEGKRRSIAQMLDAIRSGNYRRPRQAEPSIAKPLAAICEHAMAKRPDDRYVSAVALADDIERWLADEPVSAYQETTWERTRRWIRRHQTMAASAAAVVLVSIIGLGGFSLVLNQKNIQLEQFAASLSQKNTQLDQRGRELQKSNEDLSVAEVKARDEAATALAVTEFLNDDLLAQASLQDHPNPRLEVRTVLDRAAEELDAKFTDRPLVKANLHKTIGIAYRHLGEFAKAEKSLSASIDLYTEQLGSDHATTIARQSELAAVIAKSGQYNLGKETLELSLARLIALHGTEHKTVVDTQAELADLYIWLGDYENAERLIEQAIAGNTRLLGIDDADTFSFESEKAVIWNYTFRYADAVKLGRDLIARCEATLGRDHIAVLEIKTVLAQSYFFNEQYEDARKTYNEALAQSSRLLGEEHPVSFSLRHDLAQLDAELGNPGRALAELKEVRIRSAAIYGENHRETIINDQSIASSLFQLARLEEARDLLIETLSRATSVLASSPETQQIRFDLAHVYFELDENDKAEAILKTFAEADRNDFRAGDTTRWNARVLLAENRFYAEEYDQAIELLKQARAGYAKSPSGVVTWASRAVNDLLWCYVSNDQIPDAETLLNEVVESGELRDNETASAILTLADALIDAEQVDMAEARLRQLSDWINSKTDPTQATLQVMLDMAATFAQLERYEDAIIQYRRILKDQRELLGPENVDTLDTLEYLAVALYENGEPEESATIYAELLQGQQNMFGSQSLQVQLTLTAIANIRVEQGKYQDSIVELLQVRKIQNELGIEGDLVRATDQSLANAYREVADYEHAIKHYEAAVGGLEPASDDAPRLLALHQLAWCYDKNKQADAAIAIYQRVVDGRSRVLGPTHEYTLFTFGNLALVLAEQAHAMARDTLKDFESRISSSERHGPGIDSAAYTLGESYRLLGDYAAAIRWYRDCTERRTETLGESHVDSLLALHQTAYTLSLSGSLAEAAKIYAQVVPLRETALGKSHEYTMLSLTNWGVVEATMEHYDEAIRLLEDGLKRVVQAKGRDDVMAINPRLMLASSHYLKGNYTRAIQLFRETLEVTYRLLRKPNETVKREIAMLQIVLADSEVHAGRFDDAFQHATEGLATMEGIEPNKMDFFRAQSVLGEVHSERGELEKAIELLESASESLSKPLETVLEKKRLRLQIDAVNRLIAAHQKSGAEQDVSQLQATRETLQRELEEAHD